MMDFGNIDQIKSTISQSQNPADAADRLKKLRQACTDLESVFIHSLVKTLRQSVPDEDGAIPKTAGSNIYKSMADQQLSGFLAENRGTGLGDAIFNHMVSARPDLEKAARTHPEWTGYSYQKIVAPDYMPRQGFRPVGVDMEKDPK